MAKLTKKMKAIKAGVDSTKAYEINEAIAVLKQFATAKFVESVDVAVNLGIDPRKSDQNVRGATVLPHGTGREVRVAVFTQGANAEAAKAAGADFAQLARENSEEPGAVYSAGDLGFFSKGAMVKPFEEFAFNNAVGTIGLVETDFGFHVVKVTDKAEAVNIATISRKVDPSEATINSLFSKVTNFEMKAAQNPKEFANIAKKSELSVLRADNLHKNDDQIIGLGSNRSIVQWLFQKDTKIGDIKKFTSGGNYIVAQLGKHFLIGSRMGSICTHPVGVEVLVA